MLQGRPRLCQQSSAVCRTTLDRLLQHATRHAGLLELPELYKMGILLKDQQDPLQLHSNAPLLAGLSSRYQQMRTSATPFQASLLDEVLRAASPASPDNVSNTPSTFSTVTSNLGSSSPISVQPTQAREYYQAIMDIVKEVEVEFSKAEKEGRNTTVSEDAPYTGRKDAWKATPRTQKKKQRPSHTTAGTTPEYQIRAVESLHTRSLAETLGSSRANDIETHLNALEPLLRQLSSKETIGLIRTLAKLNYTNYDHTILLTRRGCEVASELTRHELCVLFFNLHKLHSRDSLVPIANRLIDHVHELTAEEVYLLCQSLERQESNSSASQRLLTPLVSQALKKLPDASATSYHRTLLSSMARYRLHQTAVVQTVLRDWAARWKTQASEKDVLVLFEAVIALVPSGMELDGVRELVERLTFLAPTMDIRVVDRVMDLLSTVSLEMSAGCMRILLTRLENESGSLSAGQLRFVLQLLSTYPPAKGQVAVVSLAYASAVRSRSMDGETLEDLLLSLATLQHYTDDFFGIAIVLQKQKGGFRSFARAQQLFECCTPAVATAEHGVEMLTSVVCTLAPQLNDEEVLWFRKAFVRLGITDPAVLQRLFSRVKQVQRGKGGAMVKKRRSGYHDPMDGLL